MEIPVNNTHIFFHLAIDSAHNRHKKHLRKHIQISSQGPSLREVLSLQMYGESCSPFG